MITDRYGRLFAIYIFSPILLYKGAIYNDLLIVFLGILLIFYECFWICTSGPQITYLK